jgi:hypothetical protein
MKKNVSVLLSMAISSVCFAGEAVSGPNGDVGFSAGNMDGSNGRNFMGSFSVPVGSNFGLQVDALFTDVSARDFYGMGAHLFWRDSEKGLIGLTGGEVRENDTLDSWEGGVESEYYLGRVTLGAQGGIANIDYNCGSLPFIETDETDYYASTKVGFYPIDDLCLSLSYTRVFDNGLVQAQVEYQTPLDGVSLFTDLAQGDNNYDHALVGLRYYFGKEKSLILRHRQDDPPNVLNSILYNIGTYGAEFNRQAEEYIADHFGTGGSGGGATFGCLTINGNLGVDDLVIDGGSFVGLDDLGVDWDSLINGGSVIDWGSVINGGSFGLDDWGYCVFPGRLPGDSVVIGGP